MSQSILDYISSFDKITIQCHNNPDADTLVSAWAVYLYLKEFEKEIRIVYGGGQEIKKRNLCSLVRLCNIPAIFIGGGDGFSLTDGELLLVVDAQYGATNLTPIKAEHLAVIDHHPVMLPLAENILILPEYQSCATIIWELLIDKGYPVDANEKLKIALAYALYTDTSGFADLHNERDERMKNSVGTSYPEFDYLKKSNLTMSELMIAADALYHNRADFANRYMIISALQCDQTILGVIGDLAVQVDRIELVVSLTMNEFGFHYSIRTCGQRYRANEIGSCISEGIGSGGGHPAKAAGFIMGKILREKYPGKQVEDVIEERIENWIKNHES